MLLLYIQCRSIHFELYIRCISTQSMLGNFLQMWWLCLSSKSPPFPRFRYERGLFPVNYDYSGKMCLVQLNSPWIYSIGSVFFFHGIPPLKSPSTKPPRWIPLLLPWVDGGSFHTLEWMELHDGWRSVTPWNVFNGQKKPKS